MERSSSFRSGIGVCILILALARGAQAQYSGGSGTAQDPYLIATAADLIALGQTPGDYDKHFVLTADIDLNPNLPGRRVFNEALIAPIRTITRGVGIVDPIFMGVFDGNDHTISNLTIRGSGRLALFGASGYPAAITNLGLKDVDISGTGHDVGGLVSFNYGSITNCRSIGTISGSLSVGGLANMTYGSISGSYSEGVVNGTNWVGGLVGVAHGSISNCYSENAVRGYSDIGGLVGRNSSGQVSNCYGVGTVTGNYDVGGLVGTSYAGSVLASFWDLRTSGQMISAGGTSKTTTEMQTADTCLDAKWDFMGETVNGVEDLWWIVEGNDYPRLWWELNEVMPKSDETVDE
jgi:hypothetical protein